MNWKRTLLSSLGIIGAVLLVFFGIGFGEILSNSGKIPVDAAHKHPSWPQEMVARFGAMPVQEHGRIKPLETLAGYKLLKYHGTRTLRLKYSDDTKRTLDPTEWLLDVLFRPEAARHYPLFVVDDPQAVSLAGITPHEARRQRYTFEEIAPALPRLKELYAEFSKTKEQNRQPQQSMIINLAENAVEFETMLGTLNWAREGLQPGSNAAPPPMIAGVIKDGRLPLSGMVGALRQAGGALGLDDVPGHVRDLAVRTQWLALYPSPRTDQQEWMSFGHLIIGGMVSPEFQEMAEKSLADWETLAAQSTDPAAFTQTMNRVVDGIETAATSRGQEWRIPWEHFYNKADFFYRALIVFVFAFLFQAVSWLFPAASKRAKLLHAGTWLALGAGLLLVVAGMVVRSVIMGRWVTSVVTNLYETILFITAIIVLVGMAAEWITRRKLALPVTAAIAAIGMFLAMKHDTGNASDTLEPLQAVLNTNFWLSIHVTTINIGYAAGLLGAGFAGVYLIARLFDPARKDGDFYRTLTNCVYGIVCFGLFFALIGTILGGLWANDSWGRFWGWDPKENGALMIVLCQLIILHARLGGYIREFGLHMLTLATGAVVAFSWWHVNLLGVGLHSYGFTSGVKEVVFNFYYIVLAVAALGVVAWFRDRLHRQQRDTGRPEKVAEENPGRTATLSDGQVA